MNHRGTFSLFLTLLLTLGANPEVAEGKSRKILTPELIPVNQTQTAAKNLTAETTKLNQKSVSSGSKRLSAGASSKRADLTVQPGATSTGGVVSYGGAQAPGSAQAPAPGATGAVPSNTAGNSVPIAQSYTGAQGSGRGVIYGNTTNPVAQNPVPTLPQSSGGGGSGGNSLSSILGAITSMIGGGNKSKKPNDSRDTDSGQSRSSPRRRPPPVANPDPAEEVATGGGEQKAPARKAETPKGDTPGVPPKVVAPTTAAPAAGDPPPVPPLNPDDTAQTQPPAGGGQPPVAGKPRANCTRIVERRNVYNIVEGPEASFSSDTCNADKEKQGYGFQRLGSVAPLSGATRFQNLYSNESKMNVSSPFDGKILKAENTKNLGCYLEIQANQEPGNDFGHPRENQPIVKIIGVLPPGCASSTAPCDCKAAFPKDKPVSKCTDIGNAIAYDPKVWETSVDGKCGGLIKPTSKKPKHMLILSFEDKLDRKASATVLNKGLHLVDGAIIANGGDRGLHSEGDRPTCSALNNGERTRAVEGHQSLTDIDSVLTHGGVLGSANCCANSKCNPEAGAQGSHRAGGFQ